MLFSCSLRIFKLLVKRVTSTYFPFWTGYTFCDKAFKLWKDYHIHNPRHFRPNTHEIELKENLDLGCSPYHINYNQVPS